MEVKLSCGSEIDDKNSQHGDNLSPGIRFNNVPEEAKSLVMFMENLNAFETRKVHWVTWNISPNKDVPEGISSQENSEDNSLVQGKNDYGINGYQGPEYPPGNEVYLFVVYAINTELDLLPGSTREDVRQAMSGKVIDKATVEAGYTT